MKLHLETNIIEGTPEEIIEYTELLEGKSKEVKDDVEDGILGYKFWYLKGTTHNKFAVLKASDNYLEDSRGYRYTYPAVSSYARPVYREDVYVKFDEAENKGLALRYFPTLDMFDMD